jgi:hypothetical protein
MNRCIWHCFMVDGKRSLSLLQWLDDNCESPSYIMSEICGRLFRNSCPPSLIISDHRLRRLLWQVSSDKPCRRDAATCAPAFALGAWLSNDIDACLPRMIHGTGEVAQPILSYRASFAQKYIRHPRHPACTKVKRYEKVYSPGSRTHLDDFEYTFAVPETPLVMQATPICISLSRCALAMWPQVVGEPRF